MKRKKLVVYITIIILLLSAFLGTFQVLAEEATETPKTADYANSTIAILTGSSFAEIVANELPNAEQVFFNTVADMLAALESEKVEAVALDEPVARNMVAESGKVMIADGYLDEFEFAFAFPKTERGKALCDELSDFLREKKEDGSLDELQHKWFDSVPSVDLMSVDLDSLPDTNGTIRMATIQYPPFSVFEDDGFFGYDCELAGLFGKERGYRIEITSLNADATIPAIQSGKYDFAANGITITEERKERILFSEPEYEGGVVLLIRDESQSASSSFLDKIGDSFEKTFVRENRYRLFLRGISITLLIVVLSTIFGTVLGFLIFMACRRGNKIANRIASIFSGLMVGMPVVVLLMILYYIVFGRASISGTAVSIIGFILTFGAEVYGMMKAAVGTVDAGQMEAAYALGYTDRRAFFRHILPQALPHFMPAYRGGLVSLIKSTAIVGYVAVEDLTKMGDIVRSRTYEAFFPLIAVAIIYFILAGLLIYSINRVTQHLDPTRRDKKDILKGIEIHD